MNKIKKGGILILVFIMTAIFSIFPYALLTKFFNEVKIMSENTSTLVTIVCVLISSIFFTILAFVSLNTKNKTISTWFSLNYAKIILFYIVICIMLISLKTETIFKYETLKEFISVQWSILGLSIAIFLIWNGVVFKYLEERRPKKTDNPFPIEQYEYINEKIDFYQMATERFNSITLLIINLMLLAVATTTVYIVYNKVTLLNQNLSIASYYFCSNTIISLFFDILLPFIDRKRKILKNMKVSNPEKRLQNRITEEVNSTLTAFETINQNVNLTNEEKYKLKEQLLYKLTGKSNTLTTEDCLVIYEK